MFILKNGLRCKHDIGWENAYVKTTNVVIGGGTVEQWVSSVHGCAYPFSVALVQRSDPEGGYR